MKIDAETAIDITLDEVALSDRYDSAADLAASCRPHERPAKAIESAAPEWMPSDETRAEIATMTPRNGPPHFSAVGVIEFAVFQRVKADTAIVEQLLRENYLPAEPLAIVAPAGGEAPDDVEAERCACPAALPEHPRLKKRRRPQTENVQRALKELYPDDIFPDQTIVPNANLCRKVRDKIKEAGGPIVSDDTIFRATNRRK
jgi:hypothetical protein